jgi:hypothetical protein
MGGVGNQLFQFYAGAYLAHKSSSRLVLDLSRVGLSGTLHNSSIAELDLPFPTEFINYTPSRSNAFTWRVHQKICRESKVFGKISSKLMRIYQSPQLGFDLELRRLSSPINIRGYFQTWHYLESLRLAGFGDPKLKNPSKWYREMELQALAKFPVTLHFRRGDYSNLKDTFGILSIDYYREALHSLDNELKGKPIWVFSDDLSEARRVLGELNFNFQFICPPEGSTPTESLFLMSMGKAIIIANSTFSWWAGALNSAGTKIITPEKWFKSLDDPLDLTPNDWTKVPSSWV